MEFLSLSRRRSSPRNVPSGEEGGETDVFSGYRHFFNGAKLHLADSDECLMFILFNVLTGYQPSQAQFYMILVSPQKSYGPSLKLSIDLRNS